MMVCSHAECREYSNMEAFNKSSTERLSVKARLQDLHYDSKAKPGMSQCKRRVLL